MIESYDAVTVQDIIDRADVGRSTFYSHFTDKRDLVNLAEDSADLAHKWRSHGSQLRLQLADDKEAEKCHVQ